MAHQKVVDQLTKVSGEEAVIATKTVKSSMYKKGKKRSRGSHGRDSASVGDEVGQLSVGTSALPGEAFSLHPECSVLESVDENVEQVLQSHGSEVSALSRKGKRKLRRKLRKKK